MEKLRLKIKKERERERERSKISLDNRSLSILSCPRFEGHEINKNSSISRPEVIQGNRYNRNSETREQNREQLVRTIDIAYGKQDNVYSQFRRPAKITGERSFIYWQRQKTKGRCHKPIGNQINPRILISLYSRETKNFSKWKN